MLHAAPPADVAPEVLFRRLLSPRPTAPVQFRFRGIDHPPLLATALHATDVADAEQASPDATLAAIVARSLTAGGLFVFDSPGDLFDLDDGTYSALLAAFFEAFFGVCPLRGRCDYDAWQAALLKGGRHHTNANAVHLLGGCYEAVNVGKHIRIIGRPERFWGVAPNALLDGHLMCHEVARKIHDQGFSSL